MSSNHWDNDALYQETNSNDGERDHDTTIRVGNSTSTFNENQNQNDHCIGSVDEKESLDQNQQEVESGRKDAAIATVFTENGSTPRQNNETTEGNLGNKFTAALNGGSTAKAMSSSLPQASVFLGNLQDIVSLPEPMPALQHAAARHDEPGAYAIGPRVPFSNDTARRNVTSSYHDSGRILIESSPTTNTQGLVEATRVCDSNQSSNDSFPQAEPVPPEVLEAANSSVQSTSRKGLVSVWFNLSPFGRACCVLLALIVLVGIISAIAIVAQHFGNEPEVLFTVQGNEDQSLNPASSNNDDVISSESQGNLTPSGIVLNLPLTLPQYTLHTLQLDQEGTSPQSRAYEWIQNDPDLDNYSESRLLQRFALATLYYATNGDHWLERGANGTVTMEYAPFTPEIQYQVLVAQTSQPTIDLAEDEVKLVTFVTQEWLSYGTHECDWFSMAPAQTVNTTVCHQDELHALVLRSNNLTGTIPPEIGLLTNLRVLNLWRNPLEGTIVSQIGALTKLEDLSIGQANLRGSIPREIESLSDSLRWLTLLKNQLDGTLPASFWKLSRLEILKIGRNEKLGGTLPQNLGIQMPELRLIMIARNSFSGPLPVTLPHCRHLIFFGAAENQFNSMIPPQLGNLPSLAKLELDDNQLSGAVPSELALLPMLNYLGLSGNPGLSGSLPLEFRNLNNTLHSFWLDRTTLTGSIPGELCSIPDIRFDCSATFCGCNCSCSSQ